MLWELLLRGVAVLAGVALVVVVVSAAIRSFVLPRNESVLVSNYVFRFVRVVFDVVASRAQTYAQRDRVLSIYAPVALIALPVVWLGLLSVAYTCIFWGLGEGSWERCYLISNNALLTIGAEEPTHGLVASSASFSEALLGLLLLTLLISYLPTIYQAFSRRELVVARLELRAGAPASATNLITWLNRSGSLLDDEDQWQRWEEWFVEIEESHTSLPIISFFRSPQPGRSWVTSAGIILDTAALIFSTVDQPRSSNAELCFKAGCIAMNRVYRFFQNRAHSQPSGLVATGNPLEEPSRRDFEHAYDQLQEAGVPVVANRAEAWQHYHELRSRYEQAVVFLAKLTVAPEVKPV
ncbi:hypothetical protein F0P96_14705 [Hymenobacter busanensis]|uniref:Uncharacterized protein n=1 Tax=Hymenobacter busanensis TaxID=2607656 RepID=A0AA88FFM0_9BACT|nr:hypothetical protein [Hymenobacter busanensis]KAA9331489.1 hypothetical protein F0P96_14705 [Hymenobacter busanensis]